MEVRDPFDLMSKQSWTTEKASQTQNAFSAWCAGKVLTPQQEWEAQAYAYNAPGIAAFSMPPRPDDNPETFELYARFPLPADTPLPEGKAGIRRLFALSRWAWWHSLPGTDEHSKSNVAQTVIPGYRVMPSATWESLLLPPFQPLYYFELMLFTGVYLQAVIAQWFEESDETAGQFSTELQHSEEWTAACLEYTHDNDVEVLKKYRLSTTPYMRTYLVQSARRESAGLPRRGAVVYTVVFSSYDLAGADLSDEAKKENPQIVQSLIVEAGGVGRIPHEFYAQLGNHLTGYAKRMEKWIAHSRTVLTAPHLSTVRPGRKRLSFLDEMIDQIKKTGHAPTVDEYLAIAYEYHTNKQNRLVNAGYANKAEPSLANTTRFIESRFKAEGWQRPDGCTPAALGEYVRNRQKNSLSD